MALRLQWRNVTKFREPILRENEVRHFAKLLLTIWADNK